MAEQNNKDGTDNTTNQKYFDGLLSDFSRYANLTRLITRDLNSYRYTPAFALYTKDNIVEFLKNPYKSEQQLRKAIQYIYGASTHFRRLIQYFVGLTIWAFVVEPYCIDPKRVSSRIIGNNYRKTLNLISSMDVKTQFPKILTVCFREDVFYGTFIVGEDTITIQQLPSDYCAISSIEGNVFNVSFDFSYFDSHLDMLEYYPVEFKNKYALYKKKRRLRWHELDAPNSFAVKCNSDIPDYALPPFAGLLREIYDLEDYRQLKLTKTALENYAMLAMTLPMDDEGNWLIDYNKAREFWANLDNVLPEEIGSVLTPMKIDKISFERSHTGDTDTIAEAEQNLFTAAGVSSLLFNNIRASSSALLLAIKVDQNMTYGVVKSIGDVVNRFLHAQPYGKNFIVNFLDVSVFNAKEAGDAYLKAASYGMPTISAYCASQGIGQAEMDSMSYLETEVLELQKMFKPLLNSAQMSTSDVEGEGATDEGGAPVKDIGEVSDSREQNRELE